MRGVDTPLPIKNSCLGIFQEFTGPNHQNIFCRSAILHLDMVSFLSGQNILVCLHIDAGRRPVHFLLSQEGRIFKLFIGNFLFFFFHAGNKRDRRYRPHDCRNLSDSTPRAIFLFFEGNTRESSMGVCCGGNTGIPALVRRSG